MGPETPQTGARDYRFSKHALEVGVVAISAFGLMGVVSVIAALSNADNSFRHPVAAAATFGVIWSSLTLVGAWLILAYYRHRLFVDSTIVRVTNCFATRQLRIANVTHAVWKSFTKNGALILWEGSARVKISFGNYTYPERLELIRFFRTALAHHNQEGWEGFELRCMPPQVDYQALQAQMRGHLRFAAIAWATAIPAMYALLIWLKLVDGLPNGNWFVVAVLPPVVAGLMIGMMWLAARGDLARARGRRGLDGSA